MRLTRAAALVGLALATHGCRAEKPGQAAGAGAPAAAAPDAPILIGHVASLTGTEATFGDSTQKGIDLALGEVNAAGGVKGRRLVVKAYDDQGRPEEAAAAAERLIRDDRAVLLIGEVASSRSLAMAPVADRLSVPMISPSSTNPMVTMDGERVRPFVFRVCFIDPFQGTVMARFARETLELRRVAILRDTRNAYSTGLADFFRTKFEALGGKIAADQAYQAGDRDFRRQLAAIRRGRPDGIYLPGYYADVGLIARQARAMGLRQPLLGGDGWDSARLFEIGGKALEGAYFSNHYSVEDPSPGIRDFVQRYRAAYGAPPDSFAATGYDAALIAADAISRARNLSGGAIREAIAQTTHFPSVTGVEAIDDGHDAVKPAVILRIAGGRARFVSTVRPERGR